MLSGLSRLYKFTIAYFFKSQAAGLSAGQLCNGTSQNRVGRGRTVTKFSHYRSALTRNAAIAIAVACIATPAFAFKDSVPDWLREAAKGPLPAYSSTTNAVVLLSDTTYTINAKGEAVEHVREAIRILRPQGRRYAALGVNFQGKTKISDFHIWSIGADGHEYSLKDSDMLEAGTSAGFELYSDGRIRGANAPAGDPGATVAMEFERHLIPEAAEYIWDVQREIPVLKQSLRLTLPAGFQYTVAWKGKELVKPIDLEHGSYLWSLADTPAVDMRDIPLAPDGNGISSRVSVHYSGPSIGSAKGDWQGVGEWYTALALDRNRSTAEMAAKAQELIAGKTDPLDRIQAIAEFVQQQIRYVAIEIGIGGNQPHPADEIFRKRYGDCKDKATLLSAMLSSVGERSTWVLVDTRRGVVDPTIPSIVGNHAIAAIEVPSAYNTTRLHSVVTTTAGKHFLIFDPTWEHTPFGQLEHELQASYGTLVDGPASQVIQLPIMKPELNTVHRTAHFVLQPDGSLTGDVAVKLYGDLAVDFRRLYTLGNQKQQQDALDRLLATDFTSLTLSGARVENVRDLHKDFALNFSVKAEHYGRSMGNLLMVRPRVVGSGGFAVDHKTRTLPINLDQTMQMVDDYQIDLPAGYAIDELPAAVKFDVGFASYTSSSEMVGNTLHYHRTYTVNEVSLPADKYPDVQKLASIIEGDEQSRAILKKI